MIGTNIGSLFNPSKQGKLGPSFKQDFSVSFDGNTQVINVANNAVFSTPLQAFTLECWVKCPDPNARTDQTFVKKDGQWIHRIDLQELQDVIWNNTGQQDFHGSTNFPSNIWAHAALTYDGTNISGFVAGVRVAQAAFTGNIINSNTNPITIGNGSAGEGLTGKITEVRISKVVRYNGATIVVPTARFATDSNTIALWHLNEGAGTIANDSSSNTLNGSFGAGGAAPTWSTDSPF